MGYLKTERPFLQPHGERHTRSMVEEEGKSSTPEIDASCLNCPLLASLLPKRKSVLRQWSNSTSQVSVTCNQMQLIYISGTYTLIQHFICKFLSLTSVSKWFISSIEMSVKYNDDTTVQ